jgi:hypothetical protein
VNIGIFLKIEVCEREGGGAILYAGSSFTQVNTVLTCAQNFVSMCLGPRYSVCPVCILLPYRVLLSVVLNYI